MTKRRNLSMLKAHETSLRRISLVREAVGVLLLCLGFFLLLTLLSHHPDDPSFNFANGTTAIHNLTGKTGAYLSDALIQALGYASGWLVIFLILPGIKLLRQSDEEEFYLDRILTLPTLAVVSTIFISLFSRSSPSPDQFPPTGPGGVLGYTLATAMQNAFGVVGTLLLLAPVLLLALMILSRFSLSGVIKYLKTDLDEINLPKPTELSATPNRVLQSSKTMISIGLHTMSRFFMAMVGALALLPALLARFQRQPKASGSTGTPSDWPAQNNPAPQEFDPSWLSDGSDRKEPMFHAPAAPPPINPVAPPQEQPATPPPGFATPAEAELSRPPQSQWQPTPARIDTVPPLEKPVPAEAVQPAQPAWQPAPARSNTALPTEQPAPAEAVQPAQPAWQPAPARSNTALPTEQPAPAEAKPTATTPGFPNPFSFSTSWSQAPASSPAINESEEDEEDDAEMTWSPPPTTRAAISPMPTNPMPASTSWTPPVVLTPTGSTPDLDEYDDEEDLEADFNSMPQAAAPSQPLSDEDEESDDPFVAPLEEAPLAPLPPITILGLPEDTGYQGPSQEELTSTARLLEQKLEDFKIKGQIIDAHPGPVITTYELDPAPGLRAAKVVGLADDLARSISAVSVRVVGNIPGKNVIGIEIPNQNRRTVYLREILDSDTFRQINLKSPLAMALGSDINGRPVVGNLAKMPHLLVAGTTGSGKSVAVNAMICSILFTARAEDVRFLMVDPKMLELSIYEGIPHLLAPVVTDVNKAATLLKWAVSEMEERYRLMSEMGVRNLTGYNQRIAECLLSGEEPTRRVKVGFDPETGRPVEQEEPIPLEKKPLIVIIIDELADLMIQVGKDVEPAIARLAQMARAAGLHLIIATQRPSVDVITGLIKANFPTRLAFQVSSKIDSRTILDSMGADRLLGMGDGLFQPPGTTHLQRIHAPFVSDSEVHKLVRFLKSTGRPEYDPSILAQTVGEDGEDGGMADAMSEEYDPLYDQAVAVVVRARKVSTSMVQRHFKIGYNRAARIVERMALDGLISEPNHAGKREVLTPNPMNR